MKVLDLFCGAGGAAAGIKAALPEAEIIGVDIKPQPRYPFRFIQADAMSFPLGRYDLVWASPPCQHYTQMLNHGMTPRNNHPDYIEELRKRLIGRWFVIENVLGAPLLNPVQLCGEMFGLRVMRHRFFETSFKVEQPIHLKHKGRGIRKQNDGGYYYRVYGHETGKRQWGAAMGIDWMKSHELAQAIPPAFSKYIVKKWLA